MRQQLYSIKYFASKEKIAEFLDRFEEILRNYDSIRNEQPISEGEKRDAFYTAIVTSVPQIQSVNFLFK